MRGFTTNHVAEEAGVSIGSLYQYFPNKQALVTAIRERHVVASLALIEHATQHPGPLRAMASELAAGLIAAHATHPGLHRVLLESVPSAGRLAGPGEDFERRYLAGFAQLAMRYAGDSAEDSRVTGTALADCLDGLVHNAARRGITAPDALSRQIIQLVESVLAGRHNAPPNEASTR